MKTKLLFSILLSFTFCLLASQIPLGFNYQAIIRNTSGLVIQNQPVKVLVSIQNLGGTVLWNEEHSLTTTQFGLATFIIGDGPNISGIITNFSKIDWKAQALYLRTQVQYPVGGSYSDMGTTQIWSVPYSLVAKDVEGPVSKLGIKSTLTYNNDSALFKVINKDGNIVFAVYNEGVRVHVSDDTKGKKGGFAVGGFGSDKAESQPYMIVTADSIRMYLDSDITTKKPKGGFAVGGFDMSKNWYVQPYLNVSKDSIRVYIDTDTLTKKPKGGFAVGGFDLSKRVSGEYLRVTRDSTRIYVKEGAKGVKGGFAVGSFDASKGEPNTFTSLTPENYLIGHRSGNALTTGKFNSFLGYETGMANDTGSYNTILGYQSGYKNKSDYNVFLGYQSGYSNEGGVSNTFLGHVAGYLNSSGKNNVFLGDSSGYNNQTGLQNIFLGNGSGKANNGDYNAFIGYQAGYKNTTGTHNSFIGYHAGRANVKGKNNIFIGYKAGYSNVGDGTVFAGNSNVYIGDQSGLSNVTGYSNVYIGQEAGKSTGTSTLDPPVFNVYIGYQSGYKEYQGTFNTFIGYQTGFENISGSWNTFIGYQAGFKNTGGMQNLFLGHQSGYNNTTGGNNVFNGYHSGRSNTTGYKNTFLGFKAGYTNSTGRYNVSLGHSAGYWETGSRRFYLSVNKGTNLSQGIDSSLIYGEFDNQIIRLNKLVGIGLTPTVSSQALEVSGNGRFTSLAGTGNRALYVDPTGILTTSTSDFRLKDNIIPLEGALGKVLALNGITYSWKNDPDHLRYIGFIAQEVEKVLPELVFTDASSGLKGINYAEITAVLAESIKSQQKMISAQQELIKELKAMNEDNQRRIQKLEQLLSAQQ